MRAGRRPPPGRIAQESSRTHTAVYSSVDPCVDLFVAAPTSDAVSTRICIRGYVYTGVHRSQNPWGGPARLSIIRIRGSGRVTVLGRNPNNHRFTSVGARDPLHGTSAPVARPARHRPRRPGCSGGPLGLSRQPSDLAASCRRARCRLLS
jgi:hypothetical protein